jgi:hypothetical protein
MFCQLADPSGRAVKCVVLRPLACWDGGFETVQRHGCLSLLYVVCCQVEVSASGLSLVQRNPTECGVSECDREASTMRRPWPTRAVKLWKKKCSFKQPIIYRHMHTLWRRIGKV